MLKSKSRWIIAKSNSEKVSELAKELKLTPLTASLLVNRGMDTVEKARYFLFEQAGSFHDPFLLNDMEKSVNRVKEAINNHEHILIFGDYDADGVSSTSILMKTLLRLGAMVEFYIPNRFTEGYGPNETAFRSAAESGVSLIITVDTGISALHEAEVAKELGVDLIITDHHEPGPKLPDSFAIVHPKLEGSNYPFRELAGAGVAFKFAHALLGEVPEEFLEMAALGTIADLVSLLGENRLIAKKGLERLKRTSNLGLQALLAVTRTDEASISEETIGFVIGPRINAAGRLGSADPAVQLLLTEDPAEASQLAEEIEMLNRDRQSLVSAMTEEAFAEVEAQFPIEDNQVLVVGKEGWNAGVIGILASRLVDKYYRPTIVLSFDSETGLAKGSARSIAGFDLFKNLSTCRDILPHFGGHPMAAGMTLKLGDVDQLRSRLNGLAREQLAEEDFTPLTEITAEVSISDINVSSIKEMELLAPFGMDNPKPKFLVKEAKISAMRKIGSDQNHLKLSLEGEQAGLLDGIGFGMGHLYEHISPYARLSAVGELSINEWNNNRKPQIFLQDVHISEWQLFDLRGLKRHDKLKEIIPQQNSQYICFSQDNLENFTAGGLEDITLIRSEEEASQFPIDSKNIVLLDLPPSKEILAELVKERVPSRIYAHFHKENSEFFSTIPTRDHFKWYYAFLAKRESFDIKRHGDELAKHRGWTKETVIFMSKVFFELDFVKINNGFISLNKSGPKRDLMESETYQQKLAQFTLENDLLFSSFQQLKSWFDQVIQGSVKNKEALTEWI